MLISTAKSSVRTIDIQKLIRAIIGKTTVFASFLTFLLCSQALLKNTLLRKSLPLNTLRILVMNVCGNCNVKTAVLTYTSIAKNVYEF